MYIYILLHVYASIRHSNMSDDTMIQFVDKKLLCHNFFAVILVILS